MQLQKVLLLKVVCKYGVRDLPNFQLHGSASCDELRPHALCLKQRPTPLREEGRGGEEE